MARRDSPLLLLAIAACFAAGASKEHEAPDPVPLLPFCRKGHVAAVVKVDAHAIGESGARLPGAGSASSAPLYGPYRLLVSGGKGRDWITRRHGSDFLGDLWALRMAGEQFQWTQIYPAHVAPPVSPPERWKSAAAPVAGDGAMVLFGGDHVQSDKAPLDDSWLYAPQANAWSELRAIGPQPAARRAHVMVTTRGGTTVVHGGKHHGTECLNDVYLLSVGAEDAAGAGDASANGTTQVLWRRGTDLPAPCRWGAAATAIEGETMAVFGGRRKDGKAYHYFDELWFYSVSGDSWEKVAPAPRSPVPPARDHHAMAFVEETSEIFVHGGRAAEQRQKDAILGDLWSFQLRYRRWKCVAPATRRPRARFLHSMDVWRGTFGSGNAALVVFGGEHITSRGNNPKLNDVWLYSPVVNAWREVSANGCQPGDTGLRTAPLVTMNLFVIFAMGILAGGIALCLYIRYGRRRGYDALGYESDEDLP